MTIQNCRRTFNEYFDSAIQVTAVQTKPSASLEQNIRKGTKHCRLVRSHIHLNDDIRFQVNLMSAERTLLNQINFPSV